MSKAPTVKNAGTGVEKTLTISLKIVDYRDDPKVLEFDNGYTVVSLGEIHMGGLVSEICNAISKTTGSAVSTYWNKKAGILNINRDSVDVDDKTKNSIAKTFS